VGRRHAPSLVIQQDALSRPPSRKFLREGPSHLHAFNGAVQTGQRPLVFKVTLKIKRMQTITNLLAIFATALMRL